jgi:hypothetical protein
MLPVERRTQKRRIVDALLPRSWSSDYRQTTTKRTRVHDRADCDVYIETGVLGFFLRLFIVGFVIRACNTAVNVMTHWGSHFEVSYQDKRNTDHTQYTQTLLLKLLVDQTSCPNVHLEWLDRPDKMHSHSTLRVNGRDKWHSDPSFRVTE